MAGSRARISESTFESFYQIAKTALFARVGQGLRGPKARFQAASTYTKSKFWMNLRDQGPG